MSHSSAFASLSMTLSMAANWAEGDKLGIAVAHQPVAEFVALLWLEGAGKGHQDFYWVVGHSTWIMDSPKKADNREMVRIVKLC